MSAEVRLQLDRVIKEFPDRGGKGNVAAVNDVSLDIYTGEFVTLLGPSGCGKTTTLRLIAGFETPTTGRILLDGLNISNQPPNKRDMALVFQNYALFPHMTVYDNVAYGLQTRGLSRRQIHERVEGALNMMSLGKLEARKPNQLSGGQQQRVALARSLVMEPRILLFDEPLSNLDAKLRVQMRSEIHRLQRRLNITSIYVTHDQIEAMALSDRIVVMNLGRIEQIGTPDEIYRYPATRFVADFIGQANFFDVTVARNGSGQGQVQIMGQVYEVSLKFDFSDAQRASAMLRPEALVLRDDPALPQVVVEQAMYLGSQIEYVVGVDGQSVVVVDHDPRSHLIPEGETVGLAVMPESIHVLPN